MFCYIDEEDYNRQRIKDEITLLQDHKVISHQGVAKLVGFCDEDGHLSVVYDLKTPDTVHNLIKKDNFGWLDRVKISVQLACLLEYLHCQDPPYIIHNLDA
ncbi:PTI1-like tyrosine-protein kinase 1 [Punica granatum]|uniref:PTI1-like tyrosine-protein kinase 1 n=1 Tax=Punica granatum TaxID=22663 RepID=A0A6P8DLS0_PUNGR|nr:PTI1-like tyrosine-protein kinase 1 [Punica granatum]